MSASRGRTGLSAVPVIPVVLLVALAFVIGSVGTAAAGGLTKGSVKKIAAKVVSKQAPTLSVKHAVTADSALTATNANNAATVGGQTAGQLGVRPIVYTIPAGQNFPTLKTWALDSSQLPAGTYLASFHMIMSTNSPVAAECQLQNVTKNDFPLDVYMVPTSPHVPSLNGTGLVTVATGDSILFKCSTGDTWSAAYPAHLTLTPVASATTGNLLTP